MALSAAALCLALNVYHESRSEPIQGQYAVASVTMNRAQGDESKICDTVFKPGQFSWTDDIPKIGTKKKLRYAKKQEIEDKAAWQLSTDIAKLTLLGFVEWKDVVSFHRYDVKPTWAASKEFKFVKRIGVHLFYKKRNSSWQESYGQNQNVKHYAQRPTKYSIVPYSSTLYSMRLQ
jgi:spore germination cell wall hydrolase CwlJ-like protein